MWAAYHLVPMPVRPTQKPRQATRPQYRSCVEPFSGSSNGYFHHTYNTHAIGNTLEKILHFYDTASFEFLAPVDPFERCKLDGSKGLSRSGSGYHFSIVYHLGILKFVERFGQSIVIAVADAASQCLTAGLGKALGLFDRDILPFAIAVTDQPTAKNWPPIVQNLLQRIEYKLARAVLLPHQRVI